MDAFVAVDLEMTGLKVKTDHILEIGAVKTENGRVTDTFQTLVNPHRGLDEAIVRLTGITDEMVRDAPDAEEAVRAFLSFAGELPLLGHNLMFDYSFLKQAAVNCDLPFERDGIDTLKIARKVLAEPERKSLDSLCDFFHIQRDRCHRALDDAKAACLLFFPDAGELRSGAGGSVCREAATVSGKKAGEDHACSKKRLESFTHLS